MIQGWFARIMRANSILPLLLGYRWLSLAPPALALVLYPPTTALPLLAFALALVDNLGLTLFHHKLNRLVLQHPLGFGMDLLLAATLIGLTGGTQSPYFLFALAPILGAAFFFQMRGGLVAAGVLSVLYLGALGLRLTASEGLVAVTQVASFFLIAITFGYPAVLLKRLREATHALEDAHAELVQKNARLERTNRELASINALAATIQSSAVDLLDVEEKILTTITGEMEFERVMLALADLENNVLIGWLTHRRHTWYESPEGMLHTCEIPIRAASGLIVQTLLEGQPRYVADAAPPTSDAAINARLALAPYAILPLIMRDHPLGVLLVDNPDTRAPIPPDGLRALTTVANQAALALGSTKLCIERAQRLAIEQERNRIAMEIHDTASQSLFGIVYALDACIKLLPEHVEEVQARLRDTRAVAQHTMNELRRSVFDIWSRELDAPEFVSELRSHLARLDAPRSLRVDIQVEGELRQLAPFVRKNLLRIAEEGLANVVKHSDASDARVGLQISHEAARLVIQDNGRGFNTRNGGDAGFGLKSIRERARVIGAEVWVESRAGAGTHLEVVLANRLANGKEE